MFGLYLDLRKIFGTLERLQELHLGIVAQGADGELHQSAPMIEARRDAHHAHTGGQCLPQIGKNFRPRETAFIDERIQEAGAIENLHGLRRPEICFESGLLLLANLNLPF